MSFIATAAAVAATVAEAGAAIGAGFMAALPEVIGGATAAEGAAAAAAGTTASATAGAAAAGGAAGLSAGAGGVAGSVGAGLAGATEGAALGAGLGATTSAIQGGDVGKGALMGAATGAVTGGAASGLSEATAGLNAADVGMDAGTVNNTASQAKGIVATPTEAQTAASTQSSGLMGANNFEQPVSQAAPVTDITAPSPGTAAYSPVPQSTLNQVNALPTESTSLATPSTSDLLSKGINLVKDNPAEAMQIGGAGINMLSTPQQQQQQKVQPVNTTDYLSPDFERYQATPVYANGGILSVAPTQAQPTTSGYEPSVGMYTGAADGYAEGGMPQQEPMQPMQPQGPLSANVANTLPVSNQAQQPMPMQPMQAQGPLSANVAGTLPVSNQAQQPVPMQQAPQGPMNPIVARAMANVQQTQAQQNQQVRPSAPPQGISPSIGIAQPQIQPVGMATGGIAEGYNLGGYAHGGNPRLLKGPGSGISDDIPATIGHGGKQPARLATGEFVVPARIVSELGSGDTDAGGRVLQQMVDRIQARRAKTVGKGKVAADSKSNKVLPA